MRSDSITEPSEPALRRITPWLIALAGFTFDMAAFWPGQMSFDSAYAWWQVRGGASTDIVPPVFIAAWRICNALLAGPGLLFALHLLLFWSGLALLVHALRCRATAAGLIMAIVAFAPVVGLLRGHVWTDVGLFSALTFVTGALAYAHVDRRHYWLLPAAPILFYATALRHNALPAIVPFVVWFAWLLLRDRAAASAARVALTAFVLLVAAIGAVRWLDTRVDRQVPVWPSLAQWDIAAVSIATDRMRLPTYMIGPGLDVAELAAAFRGWSNTPMLVGTQHGIRDPFADFSAAELAELRRAWADAILDEPRAWLAHRLRLSRALFGTHAAEWPRELIYVDDETGYRDNPPVARNAGALHVRLLLAAAYFAATPVLAAWPCVVLGLIGGALAWRRRNESTGRIAALVWLSAWLYALPLCVLAPAAELRYLGWPCVASLLTFACTAFAPRSVSRC